MRMEGCGVELVMVVGKSQGIVEEVEVCECEGGGGG